MNKNFKDRTGETNIAKNGLQMEIITYRNCDDIDIRFDDGTIVSHKKYENFKKGLVKHPTISGNHLVKNHTSRFSRIGMTRMMNCGMECMIIDVPDKHRYVVKFTDGTLRCGTWRQFQNGNILNPNCKDYMQNLKPDKTGERHVSNHGLEFTIIKYRNKNNVDIRFIDGRMKNNVRYVYIKKGDVVPPKIINGIEIGQLAYVYENQWYYICSRHDWQEERILSVQEMYDYIT